MSGGAAEFNSLACGLVAHRTTLVVGGPGSGKTLLALQTLVSAARHGEPGLYVSFGPAPTPVNDYGAAFGWDTPRLQREGRLVVEHAANAANLDDLFPGFLAKATAAGAKRLAIDSLHVAAYPPDAAAETRQLIHLRDWLFENGFSAILTSGFGGQYGASRRRRALLQLLSDCTVALEMYGSGRAAARWLHVLKYRAAPFVDTEFPFYIGRTGIEIIVTDSQVLPEEPPPLSPDVESELAAARQRLTGDIQALDHFLEIKQAELDFLLEKSAASPPLVPKISAPGQEERT